MTIPKYYQNDFYSFFLRAFESLNPGQNLDDIWHIRYLADKLNEVSNQDSCNLIINIPPRSLKSTMISVAWPAWLLGNHPATRIIVASYSQKISNKFSLDTRNLINERWFKDLYPELQLKKDQNEKCKFSTSSHGFRLATSTGGSITGEGADILILDDPHHPKEIFSKTLREKTIDWYEQVFSTRLNNRTKGKIILVMQRLHAQDLAGHLIEKNGYDLINLPIYFSEQQLYNTLEAEKMVKKGEILNPTRFDVAAIESLKADLGKSAFSAQYLGKSAQETGNIINYKL